VATYDIVQTVELLNFAANGISSFAETQANLQKYLGVYLSGGTDPLGNAYQGFFPIMNQSTAPGVPSLAGGDWQVAWGPVVLSNQPDTADEAVNAMYVAYSANLAMYVVAIAATNPASVFDWLKEDGDVAPRKMVLWPPTLPYVPGREQLPDSRPHISAATTIGISDLLTKMSSNGQSLQQFLDSKANANDTLLFTGHSLAGALSPTVALFLYGDPGKSGWKNIYVQPSAGASPGNQAFSTLFAQTYPTFTVPNCNGGWDTWNVDFTNQQDVVPHAWNQLDLVVRGPAGFTHWNTLFGVATDPAALFMHGAVDAAKLDSGGSAYYLNLPQQLLATEWGAWKSTFDSQTSQWQFPATWQSLPTYTKDNPMDIDDIGQAILITHIDQYLRYFGLVPPPKMATKVPTA
jgi:hypothetical protein